jgi:hypothetical protein
VDRLELVSAFDPSASLYSVDAEREIEGRFEVVEGAEGTKSAGEKTTVFTGDDGTSYRLANSLSPEPAIGEHVVVSAHPVEPSRVVARPGGAYLWITHVRLAEH